MREEVGTAAAAVAAEKEYQSGSFAEELGHTAGWEGQCTTAVAAVAEILQVGLA